MIPTKRYHRIDGWRGYMIPAAAVAGASDTGNAPDSPAPTNDVLAELHRFRNECLKPAGIKSRLRDGCSSNVFCAKRWVVVSKFEWATANELAKQWIADNKFSTSYIHNAE